MPFNLLLLPLLGGFIFVRYWNRTRYHAIRADKERILFLASIAGLGALVVAFAASLLRAKLFPCQPNVFCVAEWWKANVPFAYSGVALTAFCIGAAAWYPLNFIWKREDEINRVIYEDGDPFELLLKRAQDEELLVLVTMNSNKVYIGRVSQPFNPAASMRSIGLMPFKSGYREALTKRVNFTTNYSTTYAALNKETAQLYEACANKSSLKSGV